eukprot:scaffold53025_cov60-Phaeocystis_antarctica.AAC.4
MGLVGGCQRVRSALVHDDELLLQINGSGKIQNFSLNIRANVTQILRARILILGTLGMLGMCASECGHRFAAACERVRAVFGGG